MGAWIKFRKRRVLKQETNLIQATLHPLTPLKARLKMNSYVILALALLGIAVAMPVEEERRSKMTRREIIENLLEEIHELEEEKRAAGTQGIGASCDQDSDCKVGMCRWDRSIEPNARFCRKIGLNRNCNKNEDCEEGTCQAVDIMYGGNVSRCQN